MAAAPLYHVDKYHSFHSQRVLHNKCTERLRSKLLSHIQFWPNTRPFSCCIAVIFCIRCGLPQTRISQLFILLIKYQCALHVIYKDVLYSIFICFGI